MCPGNATTFKVRLPAPSLLARRGGGRSGAFGGGWGGRPRGWPARALPPPHPPSLPYYLDTSRPSFRTNRTCSGRRRPAERNDERARVYVSGKRRLAWRQREVRSARLSLPSELTLQSVSTPRPCTPACSRAPALRTKSTVCSTEHIEGSVHGNKRSSYRFAWAGRGSRTRPLTRHLPLTSTT